MKKVILTIGCATLAIFAMMSCTKQTTLSPSGAASGGTMLTTKTVKQHTDKDGGDSAALDSMAQAANIKGIHYDGGNNNYTVSTYLNSTTYTVEVVSFKMDSGAYMKVNTSNNSYFDLKFNVEDSSIYISNLGTYSFDDFSDSVISINHSFEKNLIAVMSVYYAISPQSSTSYTDNGNKDTYPDSEKRRRKFWGRVTEPGPCIGGSQIVYSHFNIFWTDVWDFDPTPRPC